MEENKQTETNNNKKKGLETKYIILIAAGALLVGATVAFLIFNTISKATSPNKGLLNRIFNIVEKEMDEFDKKDGKFDRIMDKIEKEIDEFEEADDKKEKLEEDYNKIYDNVKEKIEDQEESIFNDSIEAFVGTQKGAKVRLLLDEVILKMKKESEHPLTIKHNATTATDPDTVLTIKKGLDLTKDYEVVTDYDTEGFVNTITILDY